MKHLDWGRGIARGSSSTSAAAGPAAAQYGMDRGQPKDQTTPQLPQCAHPIGTAAIEEPDHDWWSGLGLSNPESLLKLFASRSGCLRIVDRNAGLAMRNQEESLAQSGELQRNSNVGRGQIATADVGVALQFAGLRQAFFLVARGRSACAGSRARGDATEAAIRDWKSPRPDRQSWSGSSIAADRTLR